MQILVTSISVRINNCKNIQPPIYVQCIYIRRKYPYKKPRLHRFLYKYKFQPVCRQTQFHGPSSEQTLRSEGVCICLLFKNSPFWI